MIVDRTIRNGSVKIGGRTYRPRNNYMSYDGRLDGMRYSFGVYPQTFHVVSLHSVAGSMRSEDDNAVMDGPHCVDGSYPWMWWVAQEVSE